MSSEKTAMVLGGTNPHIDLLEKLKCRGFRTVLVDYLDNPPAKEFADKHIRESTLDFDRVLDIAQANKPDLVISSCVDQANSVCCYVAEKLKLPHPYSFETSKDATDKGRMKELFKKGGVPTSDFEVRSSLDFIPPSIEYPLVVKPVDANSSKGVHKVDNDCELKQYSRLAMGYSRAGRIILEKYCPGEEIQVDCMAVDGRASVLMTRGKRPQSARGLELNSKGSIVPAMLSGEEISQIGDIAQLICESFSLRNTPFFFQAKVYDGRVSVIEFAPRIGGGLSSKLIKIVTGVDILDCSIDSYLLDSMSPVAPRRTDKMFATLLLYMKPGVFDHIEGVNELKSFGCLEYYSELKRPGDEVGSELNSGNRVASLILSANSNSDLDRCISRATDLLKVINSDGVSCMRNDE